MSLSLPSGACERDRIPIEVSRYRSKKAYECFDNLIYSLRQQGLVDPAKDLHILLHETAWTTSTELLGELGVKIRKIKKQYKKELNPQTIEEIRACLSEVNEVWRQSMWVSFLNLFKH